MKHLKKAAVCAASLLMISALGGCGDTAADGGSMRKNMSAMDYAYDMGIGTNLGNTLEAFWSDTTDMTAGATTIGSDTPKNYETCWGAVETTQACIDGLRDAGFRTVRIPVYWGNMMEDDGTYTINSKYINRVQEVVDYCRNDGLYAVVNMHHYDEFLIKNHTQEEVLEAVGVIWKQIAEHFRNYSDYLIFEGFNEAVGNAQDGTTMSPQETYEYVNALNQKFVDTVRGTGGNNKNRVLIASGYFTNIDNTTDPRFLMPEDSAEDRLMVSVHYIDNMPYWTNRVGSEAWETYSRSQCELLKEAFIDKGIPVFVGEMTSIYTAEHIAGGNADNSAYYLQTIVNMAVDYDLIPVLWDVHNNFYSRTENIIFLDDNQLVIRNAAAAIASKSDKEAA